jgi:hypothetical protein
MNKTIYYIIALLVISLPLASALDITALAQGSGTLRINKPTQTKIETALGIDISKLTGVQANNIAVTVNKMLQIGSIYVIIARINGNQYTIIVPAYKLAEYIK